ATDMSASPVGYAVTDRAGCLQTSPPLQASSKRHSTYQPSPTIHHHHRQQQEQQQQQQQQQQHQIQQRSSIPYEMQTSSPAISQAYTQAVQQVVSQSIYDNNYYQPTLGSTSVSMDMPTMARESAVTDSESTL